MDGRPDASARPPPGPALARHSRLCRAAQSFRRHAGHARRRTICSGFRYRRPGARLENAPLMMKLMRLFVPLCVSAVLLVAGETILTQPKSLIIDPAQAKVDFTLGSLLHTVHGTFQLKRGTLS